jgi:hypothetical protein
MFISSRTLAGRTLAGRTLAGAALTSLALIAGQPSPASAADIYDKYGPRTSSPYDDPRYADIYALPPPPPPPRPVAPRYAPGPEYAEPLYERPYAYREAVPAPRDRYGYLRPMEPRPYRTDEHCVPRGEIRRALVGEGWRDFEDAEFRGPVALVRARRPNGQLYALEVDRCTGNIVRARPLDDRPVPYAYRDRYDGSAY